MHYLKDTEFKNSSNPPRENGKSSELKATVFHQLFQHARHHSFLPFSFQFSSYLWHIPTHFHHLSIRGQLIPEGAYYKSLCTTQTANYYHTRSWDISIYVFKLKPSCLEVMHSTPMFWVHLLGEQLTFFNILMTKTPFQVTVTLLPYLTDMDWVTVGCSDFPGLWVKQW